MKILLGMSGGVDSSVAALLLLKRGFEVIGATMSIWGEKGKGAANLKVGSCGYNEEKTIEEAKKVAKQIGIPHYVIDCIEVYEDKVLKTFKLEYLHGRTPNPCILCNTFVKFKALPKLAEKQGISFDKFGTGHYASIEKIGEQFLLKQGVDQLKDQTYFLYRLGQEQLQKMIFPLGNYTKAGVRKIAKEEGLIVAEKPDSQDFYYHKLLNFTPKEGNIVNLKGEILGKHQGIWNYTIGQRKGLGIAAAEPLYVLSLRETTNEVVVGFKNQTFKEVLIIDNLHWSLGKPLGNELQVLAKTRSTQIPVPAVIRPLPSGKIEVSFILPQKLAALGQSVVFYQENFVLGGGIISEIP